MRLAVRSLLILSVASVGAFASSFTFTGPDADPTNHAYGSSFPTTTGLCNPTSTNCILATGDPTEFVPQSATITLSGNTLQLSITTYSPTLFDGYGPNAFGDALFQWTPGGSSTPTYWGISLGVANGTDGSGATAGNAIDGLTLGDLYESSATGSPSVAYQNSFLFPTDTPPGLSGVGTGPVLINPTWANLVGNTTSFSVCDSAGCSIGSGPLAPACTDAYGTLSCHGVNQSNPFDLWTITDDITLTSAGLNFLSNGSFEFDVASFVCANGNIVGAATVPEPRGLVFLGAALLLVAGWFARSRATKTAA